MNLRYCIVAGLVWLAIASTGTAKVVGVESGAGSGFLFTHRGNCFVIMPSHVHKRFRTDIPVDSYQSGTIGSADIVYIAPEGTDISLGLVKGAVTDDCGPSWSSLPRSLTGTLDVGGIGIIERARQQSVEGRRVQLHSKDFSRLRFVPDRGEERDLFGGTSGATVFINGIPVGMVLQAESAEAVWALRMDEIVNLLARFMGEVPAQANCATGVLSTACDDPAEVVAGDPYEVISWSTHPIENGNDPSTIASGEAPYIAPLSVGAPVVIDIELTETDRLHRIRILSDPDETAAVPKDIEIITDVLAQGRSRPNPMPRRDMSPDGVYDNKVGERFAKRVTIRITSSWGGGSPIRIDRIEID